jgi:hypothetical protein
VRVAFVFLVQCSAVDDFNADNNVCADQDATFLSSMIGRINRAE